MGVLEEISKIDFGYTVAKITSFIRSYVGSSGASGVVVGLSGGVDSSVTLALLSRAINAKKILGLVMPTSFTPKQDINDAIELAETFGVRYRVIPIDDIVEAFKRSSSIEETRETRIAIANLRARIRMSLLYLHANLENLLVAGTSDKSEILLGYYTKYGDGASDFLVISHLYKTQVRLLGKYLGLSERIYAKPPSPQLYPGHRAVDELPADYEVLDQILYLIFDKGFGVKDCAELLGIDLGLVVAVAKRFLGTAHKRSLPPAPEPLSLKIDIEGLRKEVSEYI